MIAIGIDVGAISAKAAMIEDGRLIGSTVILTGYNARNAGRAVFAESEVISLIANGECRTNIIAGIHDAVGARVVAMAGRVGMVAPVMMTGGVANNIGVVNALEKKAGMAIHVSPHAQVNGAIGAALIAAGNA